MNDAAAKPLFYGWVMLGVAMGMAFATMPGQTVLVSLWKEAAGASLGLSITSVSAAYTVATICAGLPLPWVGRAADRLGLRATVLGVSLAFAASLAAAGWAGGIVSLGVVFFLVRFLGQGSLGMLSGHVTAMWFERKLGRAHAMLAIGGFAAGSALLPQPTAWAIERFGWSSAMLLLAGLVFVLTVPAAVFVFRNKPEDIGQRLDGESAEPARHDVLHGGPAPPGDPAFTAKQAAGTRAFWILAALTVMTGFVGTALLFHMPEMLRQAGLEGSARQAALANQPWPIAFGLATVAMGWLVDRFEPSRLLPGGLVLMAAGIGLCVVATRGLVPGGLVLPVMAAGMGVYGASQAVITGVTGPTTARYFGRTHHGSIRGVVTTMMVVGTGGAPYLIALAYELSGDDFTWAYAGVGLLTVPLLAASLTLRRPTPPADRDLTPDPDEPDPAMPEV